MGFLGDFFDGTRKKRTGRRDFTERDLPDTRPKLFWDTLGIRWSAMVGVNLLYLLFWLPAAVWTGVNLLTISGLAGSVADAGELAGRMHGLFTTYFLILVPLVALTGPATAGVSFVLRNWARGENSFVFSDFKDAFRRNWRQSLGVGAITGCLPLLGYLLVRFYGGMARNVSGLFAVVQGLVLAMLVLWLLMLQTMYMLIVTYRLTFRQVVKNAFLLTAAKLPLALGIRLAALAIPAAGYALMRAVPDSVAGVLLFLGFFYTMFGLAFDRLLYAAYANAVCEKYINPKIDGAGVEIGLRPKG